MQVVPLRSQPPARAATPRGAAKSTATAAPHAAAAAHPATAHAAKPADRPVTTDDADLIERQAAFDRFMQMRAELDREANALRELAMEQIKRDDSIMNAWIKLI
ncbi:MAG TPA: hypothetical protein VMD91_06235 [Candidatus Sulfotelmatobacter sp.]|nr:hypothetical protein [Candidatus Sulfotelmatobacter sp.]